MITLVQRHPKILIIITDHLHGQEVFQKQSVIIKEIEKVGVWVLILEKILEIIFIKKWEKKLNMNR